MPCDISQEQSVLSNINLGEDEIEMALDEWVRLNKN